MPAGQTRWGREIELFICCFYILLLSVEWWSFMFNKRWQFECFSFWEIIISCRESSALFMKLINLFFLFFLICPVLRSWAFVDFYPTGADFLKLSIWRAGVWVSPGRSAVALWWLWAWLQRPTSSMTVNCWSSCGHCTCWTCTKL